MIAKIRNIKKLGLVFADFNWTPSVPAFKPVNLIYGWNGSGKTTLTRLFDAVAVPSANDLEYALETDEGVVYGNGDTFPLPIRVFNQDYVQKNVKILESSANTISVLLGEENKDLVAQIAKDEVELNGDPLDPTKKGLLPELHGYSEKKKRKERENDTAFSSIAATIGAAIAGSGVASRTYRKPDAERDFAKLAAPSLLTDEQLEEQQLCLKQEALPELGLLKVEIFLNDGVPRTLGEAIDESRAKVKDILVATVEAKTLERLITYPDIAHWVEEGHRIHAKHGSTNCEYCESPISPERLTALANHFSKADAELKRRIDSAIAELDVVLLKMKDVNAPDEARLYQEQRVRFTVATTKLSEARNILDTEVRAVRTLLEEKRDKTNEAVPFTVTIDAAPVAVALDAVNNVLVIHNSKSREFQTVRQKAHDLVIAHYLSTISDDVARRQGDIDALNLDLPRREEEIAAIQKRILEAKSKISSAHEACDRINAGLKTFLGRDELRFEPNAEVVDDGAGVKHEVVSGYKIMRGDHPATYLSEGEKSAIAFVYFVVHLDDGQFAKADGIVVIDDPVSSLDSNSLYQAFAFLKGAVKMCRQVFVLTHNFDFLKLLLNWRSRVVNKTGYYMVRNQFVGDARRATIDEMDNELRHYESEYHYLFKRLKEMYAEQDGTIMRAYPVPNIARKVWETFLMYRVPNGASPYEKMEKLKVDGLDAQKLDAIYKFTNDQSHMTGGGFDPSLVPETQKVLGEIFDLMNVAAPDHYAVLDQATPI